MIRVGRYAGSIVVEHDGGQILVGNPKEPCAVKGPLAPPWVRALDERLPLSGCQLLVAHERPDELARIVAEKLLIERNGSVSERLWRLITDGKTAGELPAQWLVDAPTRVWQVVRDTVLKCT
jgi:hypothetical protein